MTLISILRRIALAFAFVVGAGTVGFAQSTAVSLGVQNHDATSPVEISAEELSVDQASSQASFKGGVLVRQGDLTMACDAMTVEYGPDENGADEIKVIRMTGGVTFASPSETAESQNAVYNLKTEIITMTGSVLVTQGVTALSSDKLTYNLQSGDGLMEGNVKTVLQGNN